MALPALGASGSASGRGLKTLVLDRQKDLNSSLANNNEELFILPHLPDTHPNQTNLNPHSKGVFPSCLFKDKLISLLLCACWGGGAQNSGASYVGLKFLVGNKILSVS